MSCQPARSRAKRTRQPWKKVLVGGSAIMRQIMSRLIQKRESERRLNFCTCYSGRAKQEVRRQPLACRRILQHVLRIHSGSLPRELDQPGHSSSKSFPRFHEGVIRHSSLCARKQRSVAQGVLSGKSSVVKRTTFPLNELSSISPRPEVKRKSRAK